MDPVRQFVRAAARGKMLCENIAALFDVAAAREVRAFAAWGWRGKSPVKLSF
jgi:hypothetical protein